MENSSSFRYKFNILIWILLALVLVLCLAGIGLNAYGIISIIKNGDSGAALKVIMLAVSLFLSAYIVSVMAHTKYVIKNGFIYTYFGFIRIKVNVNKITQFSHFKKSDTLVAYFDDERYTVIVISPDKYDDFIKGTRKFNPKITFDWQSEDN